MTDLPDDIPASCMSHAALREQFERLIDMSPQERATILGSIPTPTRHVLSVMLAVNNSVGPIFPAPASEWARGLALGRRELDSMIGTWIGPYRITGFIGEGGSAIVFSASSGTSNRPSVALKLLRHGAFSENFCRRFERERATLASFTSPNIVALIGAGRSASGIPYLAMENVRGVPLLTHADSYGLDVFERIVLLLNVCRAVDVMHRSAVVHCDLKASNILVSSAGKIKIIDFGLAKPLIEPSLLTELEHIELEHIELTPGYAAPEQYLRGPISRSSDVYALGVLAGELLCGIRLGAEAVAVSTGEAIETIAVGECDQPWLSIIRSALAHDSTKRYQTAGKMADAIESALEAPWRQGRLSRVRLFICGSYGFHPHKGSRSATASLRSSMGTEAPVDPHLAHVVRGSRAASTTIASRPRSSMSRKTVSDV